MASCLKAKARQGAYHKKGALTNVLGKARKPKRAFCLKEKARDALSFLKWKTHEAQVRDKAQKANRLFSSL